MKTLITLFSLFLSFNVLAEATVNKPAPEFTEKNQDGKLVSLKDFKGKWTVLEWFNEGCPYVKKHYGSGNMQKLQKTYTNKGVNWLTVATSAKGLQGYVDPADAKKQIERVKMASTALLLDADGTMGNAYGAKTTPHIFVINPKGTVVYAGAIDDNDSSNPKVIAKSKNYLVAALEEGMSGKTIQTPSTKPYGCSVKYE